MTALTSENSLKSHSFVLCFLNFILTNHDAPLLFAFKKLKKYNTIVVEQWWKLKVLYGGGFMKNQGEFEPLL